MIVQNIEITVTDYYDIAKAVKLAKVSRHTILKNMSAGKLSYKLSQDGKKVILLADLQKLFNIADPQEKPHKYAKDENAIILSLKDEIATLQQTISSQNKEIANLKQDKAYLEKQLGFKKI
ncbi:MAG: hypothetical protein HQL68_13305 [Magnetococcales bacterium]|nr:hypothetical protein [Magnetococcales bacterium]